MTIDEYIASFEDDDREALIAILDELVHDAKGNEAAQITNDGPEEQLAYLAGGNEVPDWVISTVANDLANWWK